MKKILYISLIIALVTYLGWGTMPKGSFYVGNALFIFGLCLYLFLSDKKSFICFLLLSYSISNLMDELFFNPTILQVNELIFALITPILWVIKVLYYDATVNRK